MAGDPLYRQIAEDLRKQIESGELAPGSQLPTELELREHYGNASRNTVRDAIKWLTTRRLVVTQPGRGTFVVETTKPFIVPLNPAEIAPVESDGFMETARQQGAVPFVSPPRVEIQKAREEVPKALGIDDGASVVIRHQERFIDGRPSSLQTSYYPMEFVHAGATRLLEAVDISSEAADISSGGEKYSGVTKYLEVTLGVRQVGYRDLVRVRAPTVGEVAFFKIPDIGSVLVLVVRRTAYAEGRKPIRYTRTVYAADRNYVIIDYGAVPPLLDFIQDL
jgi:GntR family transcriptional regulator